MATRRGEDAPGRSWLGQALLSVLRKRPDQRGGHRAGTDHLSRRVHRRAAVGFARHRRRVDVGHRVRRGGAQGDGRPAHRDRSYADFVRHSATWLTPPIRWVTRSGTSSPTAAARRSSCARSRPTPRPHRWRCPPSTGCTVTLTAVARGAWANGTGSVPRRAASSSWWPRPRQPERPVHPGHHHWAPGSGAGLGAGERDLARAVNVARQPALRRHRPGGQRAGHRRGHRDRDDARRRHVRGLRDLPPVSPDVSGTLRISVDQGAPADYVLFPGGNPTDVARHRRRRDLHQHRRQRSGPSSRRLDAASWS